MEVLALKAQTHSAIAGGLVSLDKKAIDVFKPSYDAYTQLALPSDQKKDRLSKTITQEDIEYFKKLQQEAEKNA